MRRTDVFSVGAVLYEIVTGRRAFPGESHAVIFAAILGRTPPAPTGLNPDVPPELERLIIKALEKDRELRYQSVADMRADLLRLRRESDAGHLAVSTHPERWGGETRRPERQQARMDRAGLGDAHVGSRRDVHVSTERPCSGIA